MTEVYIITLQKEYARPDDPESFHCKDLTIFQTKDCKKVLNFIGQIEIDSLYLYYLTVWTGDPESYLSESESVSLEEYQIDSETFISEYLE